ncbi:Acyl-CoA-binding domain-containing protein 6 [Durusdinium trenchii]|uniref:Acyl-CoA-binding domain-containing protein 6 n=1 Tax=Durusdinium trenchii TaxID=1381693 RepID=A0ABP0KBI9_9DINO
MDERLFDAARRNQAEEVEEVIKANPELLSLQDRWGLTALHSSAVAGGAEVIAVLLEARAELEAPSRSGQTALHFAAREGRDAAVAELIRRHADVSRRSAHGILPLELAAGHPNTQQLIREEANRRIKVAEQDIEMLQERLQRAVEAKELLEAQLTEPPASHHSTMLSDAEILAPITALQQATRDLARSAALADDASQDYWRRAAAWLGVQRHRGWAALYGSYMRDPVNGAGAAGACMEPANAPPLPVFDPEDPELPASYARLALVAEEKQKRRQAQEASRATEADAALEEEILGMVLEQAIDENTGRSPSEWEDIVTQLSQADASWDWSKLEVRQVEPRKKNSLCVSLGVFAVAPAPDEPEDDATVGPSESKEVPEGEAPPAPPPLVFEAGDLVGPIGGLLRRKKAYMAEHYGSSVWFFHDPNAHELPLRIQSTELRTEPLVVDLSLGSSNRLRFLRDRREDPLELSELLPPPSDASLAEQSLISEPLWPARSAMARINSRSLPPSLAPPMSAPMSRGPDSPIAASLAASSICASSYEQMVLAPAEANVQIVDVHVHGWPYSFVVATNPIYAEEELVLDRGEEFWARQRKVLERLQLVGPTMEEILTGVTLPEPAPPDLSPFPPRTPHVRPSSKPHQ